MGQLHKGVYSTLANKYNARIRVDGRTIHLGSFETMEGAAEAYDMACMVLGRPISSYNSTEEIIHNPPLLQRTLAIFIGKGVMDADRADALTKRLQAALGMALLLTHVDTLLEEAGELDA